MFKSKISSLSIFNKYSLIRLVNCTRWSELIDSISFHAGVSKAAGVTSEFRLLNAEGILFVLLYFTIVVYKYYKVNFVT